MKEGDIIMIFGNPIKMEYPIGQAKLIEKVSDINEKIEDWWVEYLDQPDHKYIALIKKPDKVSTLEKEGYSFETGI
jgi:hypothetical protein